MKKSDVKNCDPEISLIPTISFIYSYLTKALCDTVFGQQRDRERQKEWSLWKLVQFWTEVTLRAPQSLTLALEECRKRMSPTLPRITTSNQAFFQKSADLAPRFFAAVFEKFLGLILPVAERKYGRGLKHLSANFPEIWILDGSQLSAVFKRLKELWNIPNVMLPGCLMAVYDLHRGIPRYLKYHGDAALGEMKRATEAIKNMIQGTLLLADRYYAKPAFTVLVEKLGGFILTRYNKTVKLKDAREISRRIYNGGILTESLVRVGGKGKTPAQVWRFIYWKKGNKHHRLITTVIDPRLLSAEDALALYPRRWSIERMFYDLKEVLNLNCIYCSNPNAVAQQVYAAAMVYTGLRICQADIAGNLSIDPEDISVEKLFPRVVAVAQSYTQVRLAYVAICLENPGKQINEPDWAATKWSRVKLSEIRVIKRQGKRKKRKFNVEGAKWKSFAHFTRTKALIQE